ncbi:phage BR0599 family protein [Microbulbifer sp. OS29]|uniref:Phage BR0599 family protein n=1 Tax=Microbulbifer okhotskensis TaxID=2926617 RepID=A0A9X2ENH3_9GAMM|nr:phage BR0599 family protein [Microbulbifer okhotskensis]MCO1335462.1 phage BR0599 family protein [Microbulbifer okhotskensis]
MSFNGREISIDDGQPVRLYEFVLGPQRWLYTNAQLGVAHNLQTFISCPGISDDGIRQTGETSADLLTITAPLNFALVNLYQVYPPSTPVSITVYDKHLGEDDALVVWVGEIADVTRRRDHLNLVCAPLSSRDTTGLRLTWSRHCPNALYDVTCGVNKELHRVDSVLAEVTGLTLMASEFAAFSDGHFSGGFVEWLSPTGILEQRGIDSHNGTNITLLGGSLDLVPGLELRAYPGCARTITECTTKFSNSLNFGGVPGMPGKSPFDGDPVF